MHLLQPTAARTRKKAARMIGRLGLGLTARLGRAGTQRQESSLILGRHVVVVLGFVFVATDLSV